MNDEGILAGRELLRKVDAYIHARQEAGESDNKPRFYCGASAIGKECSRERWYDFRWASKIIFEARMLRLFDRGHKEEHRILEWLGNVGAEIRATSQRLLYHDGSDSYMLADWDVEIDTGMDTPDDVTELPFHVERAKRMQGLELKQWGFKDYAGHFSGHADGKVRYVPMQDKFVPSDEWILGEFKTHNAKSFADLAGAEKDRKAWLASPPGKFVFPGRGVALAKPEHMVQMQHYMHYLGCRLALYVAVNKDTDDIHFEFVRYDPKFHIDGQPLIREVIHSPRPPRRVSASPSYFKCKMCDHRRACHFGEPMMKNCRTCIFSHAIDNGEWACRKWGDKTIPREAQLVGCGMHQEIKD